jgi:hypothetical protein
MRCISCRRVAVRFEERYLQIWCLDCLPQIEFEERLAQARGLRVLEVICVPMGGSTDGPTVVYGAAHGTLSRDDLVALRPQLEDAINDLVTALVAFKRSVFLDERKRVRFFEEGAATIAEYLVELAARVQPLLDRLDQELQHEVSGWLWIAEEVVRLQSTRKRTAS